MTLHGNVVHGLQLQPLILLLLRLTSASDDWVDQCVHVLEEKVEVGYGLLGGAATRHALTPGW